MFITSLLLTCYGISYDPHVPAQRHSSTIDLPCNRFYNLIPDHGTNRALQQIASALDLPDYTIAVGLQYRLDLTLVATTKSFFDRSYR